MENLAQSHNGKYARNNEQAMNLHKIKSLNPFDNYPWWTALERGNRGTLYGYLIEVQRDDNLMLLGIWQSNSDKDLKFKIFVDEWHDDMMTTTERNSYLKQHPREWSISQFHTQEFMEEVKESEA